tara:strand:- start:300 stop:449 length:150 start_codon:yes stop_codon:yes gene_type:complete
VREMERRGSAERKRDGDLEKDPNTTQKIKKKKRKIGATSLNHKGAQMLI